MSADKASGSLNFAGNSTICRPHTTSY